MAGEVSDVVIIGSGPAGMTAGIYAVRAGAKTAILAGARWGGQLILTTGVENFPGFPEGIGGPQLMQAMRQQVERLGVNFITKDVSGVDFSKRPFRLVAEKEEYLARAVVVATGATDRWLGVPGEEQLIGRGVSSCAPCDAAFFKDKKVVVVGGGDSAMEEASVLTKFASEVTIVHRRDEFRAAKVMQERVLADPKVKTLLNTQVVEVVGTDKVTGVKLATGEKQWEMPVDGVFVAIGHDPATNIFSGKLDLDEKGYIKRVTSNKDQGSSYEMMTSVEGVFVAGDVHDFHYKQAVTAAGYGCQAALEAVGWLEERATTVGGY